MKSDERCIRMEKAKSEMDRALAEVLNDALDNKKFEKFVQTRQKYWKLADEWLFDTMLKCKNQDEVSQPAESIET